jgi:hypothetical protein
MDVRGRVTTPLRYRFADLAQARAHVHDVHGRKLFFYRDHKLRLMPYAPVMLEWSFEDDEPERLLHGWVLENVEGSGTWLELLGTGPLRDLSPSRYTRRWPRLGCDLLVELRSLGRIDSARMLDLSGGGARITGAIGLLEQQPVEIRLVSSDRLTFRDLAKAGVAWTDLDEAGVEFDLSDALSRQAIKRLLREAEQMWDRAWEAYHPKSCCAGSGSVDPEPPRLRGAQEQKIAP